MCIFGSTTFVLVLVSWMCKKQTAVSHSSTESDIISPNAGFRVEGLPALDLWDIVIEVLRSTNNNVQPSVTLHSKTEVRKSKEDRRFINCLMWIMRPQTHSSQNDSQLYIFEE